MILSTLLWVLAIIVGVPVLGLSTIILIWGIGYFFSRGKIYAWSEHVRNTEKNNKQTNPQDN